MTRTDLDTLWFQAMRQSIEEGEDFIRYHFAALVAAHEREACAQACDIISEDQWALYKGHFPYTGGEPGRASNYTEGTSHGAEVCAAAIRARGET